MDRAKYKHLALVYATTRRVDTLLAQKIGYPTDRESVRILGSISEFLEMHDTSALMGFALQDAVNVIYTLLVYGATLDKTTEEYQAVLDMYIGAVEQTTTHLKFVVDVLKVRETIYTLSYKILTE